jgi:hypothetical protein
MKTALSDLKTMLGDCLRQIETMEDATFSPIREAAQLPEVAARLREAVGKEVHFSIDLSVTYHTTGNVDVNWQIYMPVDAPTPGDKFHQGKTLAEACNKVLAKLKPLPEAKPDTEASAIECVTGLADPNIPF